MSAQSREDRMLAFGRGPTAVLSIPTLQVIQPRRAAVCVNHNPPMLAIGCLRGKTTRAEFPRLPPMNTMGEEERSIAIPPNLSLINASGRTSVATI
jgi:hypothetical protein